MKRSHTVVISPVSLSRSRSKNDCSSSGFNMLPFLTEPLRGKCTRELAGRDGDGGCGKGIDLVNARGDANGLGRLPSLHATPDEIYFD
jgi:hypothetical protein